MMKAITIITCIFATTVLAVDLSFNAPKCLIEYDGVSVNATQTPSLVGEFPNHSYQISYSLTQGGRVVDNRDVAFSAAELDAAIQAIMQTPLDRDTNLDAAIICATAKYLVDTYWSNLSAGEKQQKIGQILQAAQAERVQQ